MNITLGVYDLFGNAIPGLLYLYILNEVLKLLNLGHIDMTQVDKIAEMVLIGVVAYILGHIFSEISYTYWYHKLVKKRTDQVALTHLQNQHKGVKIQFVPSDAKLLIGVIRHQDLALAQSIEMVRANAILLRNVSLGLIFFSALQVVLIVSNHLLLQDLALALASAILSVMALKRSTQLEEWYYRDIFKDALNYGPDLESVYRCIKSREGKKPLPSID